MAGTSLPPSVLEGGLCSLPLHQGWLWAALTNREGRARGPNNARAHKGLGQGEGGPLPEARGESHWSMLPLQPRWRAGVPEDRCHMDSLKRVLPLSLPHSCSIMGA